MLFSPGTQVKFKAALHGPIATVGSSRVIGGVQYAQVMWTDPDRGFQITEVPADLLLLAEGNASMVSLSS